MEKQEVPPMQFEILCGLISDSQLSAEIDKVLSIKVISDEKTLMDVSPILNDFIGSEIDRFLKSLPDFKEPQVDSLLLNTIFKNALT